MELAAITTEKIAEMLLMILAGATAGRFGIIDEHANKRMSDLLLLIVAPALIVSSYQIEFKMELLVGLGATLALSAASFAIAMAVSRFFVKPGEKRDLSVEKISLIYPNCGFIGIPLVYGILGKEGVFYMTAYNTVFNLMIWSHGVSLMSGSNSFKNVLKNLLTPSTIAIGIGLALFFFQIRLPAVIGNPVELVGNMNTPLAMLIAGASLAKSDLISSFKRKRTYYLSFLKLVLIPVLTLAGLILVGAPSIVLMVIFVAAACPTGAMGTMFAIRYHRDSDYASELFAATTLLSMLTVPALTLLASMGTGA